MQFGIVRSYWQPLVTKGRALGEVCLADQVWEAYAHLPVLCKCLAPHSSVLSYK